MDPSLRFGHCSNTTPSFNDIFSTVLFCFEPCSPTTTLSLANVQPPSAEVGFRHSFSMSIVKSTGSCAGISYLGLGGLSTYWRLSTPTSAVVDNCQPFDSKRSLAFISLNGASRAICPVPLLLTASELEIVFKTIISEALLKKLPVFISDLNCLTYPLIALYFIYASSCFYSLAKSFSFGLM
jgi:hypothetical protein